MNTLSTNIPMNAQQPTQSSQLLEQQMVSLRQAIRLWHLTRGLAVLSLAIVIMCLASFALDYLFVLDHSQRAVLLGTFVIAVLTITWLEMLSPILRRPDDHWLLVQIEKRHPELRHSLLSTWDLILENQQGKPYSELRELAIKQGLKEIRHLSMDDILDNQLKQRLGMLFVICVAMMIGGTSMAINQPQSLTGIWFSRNIMLADLSWPQTTFFEIDNLKYDENGQAYLQLAKDHDWQLPVKIRGRQPRAVWIDWVKGDTSKSKDALSGDITSKRLPMMSRGSYQYFHTQLDQSLRFQLRGGDSTSDIYELRIVKLPFIKALDVYVQPPAYTKLPGNMIWQYGKSSDIAPPAPARVKVNADVPAAAETGLLEAVSLADLELCGATDQPISSGTLTLTRRVTTSGKQSQLKTWELPLDIIDADKFSVFVPGKHECIAAGPGSMNVLIKLTGAHGLAREEAMSWNLRLLKDKLPQSKASLKGIGSMVTSRAAIPMAINVLDDYGVKDLSLKAELQLPQARLMADGKEKVDAKSTMSIPIIDGKNRTQINHEWTYELESMTLPLGSLLKLAVEATDHFDRSNETKKSGLSSSFYLRVVDDQEIRAHLLGREQEHRQEFERTYRDQGFLTSDCQGFLGKVRTSLKLAETENTEFDNALFARVNEYIRRQNLMRSRSRAIHRQFYQIYLEVINNRIEDTRGPLQRRLDSRVLRPLTELFDQDIPAASKLMEVARSHWQRKDMTAFQASWKRMIDQQLSIEAKMEYILKAMLKAEGFQEAVNMALEIYSAQEKVNQKTKTAKLKEIEDLFDDE